MLLTFGTAFSDQNFGKTGSGVAAGTIFAESPTVGIVATVAIDALVAKLGRIARTGMAGRADQARMLAGQGIAGLAIVIEPPGLPVGCVMTVLTLRRRSQSALVMIVNVARCTGRAFGRKRLVGVASRADQLRMLAKQREAGEVMIEAHAADPGFGIVAIAAIGAQFAEMLVVLDVARDAVGGQLHFQRWLDMATLALRGGVLSGERKARHGVVIEAGDFPVCH